MLPLTVLLLWPAGRVAAQSSLYVEHKGAFNLVRYMAGDKPFVDEGGRQVAASGHKYALQSVEEFAPYVVSLRNLRRSREAALIGGYNSNPSTGNQGSYMASYRFEFSGELESPYPLEKVFIIFDLKTELAGRVFFVREIGDLHAYEMKPFDFMETHYDVGGWTSSVHLFASGHEVLHTGMPSGRIDEVFARMIERRIKDKTNANAAPFIGPAPQYPPRLKAAKIPGQAVVAFTVSPTGKVLEPKLKSASAPAFGEAAVAAARQWHFLPQVRDGHPVEKNVEMPFTFQPEDNPLANH